MLQPVDRRRSCPPRDDRTRLVLHDEYAFSAVYIETYIVALHWAVLRLWIGALCATTPRSAVDHTAVTRGTAQCLHRYGFVDGGGVGKVKESHDAQESCPLCAGVPASDGGVGA